MTEFKIVMRHGEKMGVKAVAKVTKAMTDPDEMMVMLRDAREDLEEVYARAIKPSSSLHVHAPRLIYAPALTVRWIRSFRCGRWT